MKFKISRRLNLPRSVDGLWSLTLEVWKRQIEEDGSKGRLDELGDEALAEHRAGKSKEL